MDRHGMAVVKSLHDQLRAAAQLIMSATVFFILLQNNKKVIKLRTLATKLMKSRVVIINISIRFVELSGRNSPLHLYQYRRKIHSSQIKACLHTQRCLLSHMNSFFSSPVGGGQRSFKKPFNYWRTNYMYTSSITMASP